MELSYCFFSWATPVPWLCELTWSLATYRGHDSCYYPQSLYGMPDDLLLGWPSVSGKPEHLLALVVWSWPVGQRSWSRVHQGGSGMVCQVGSWAGMAAAGQEQGRQTGAGLTTWTRLWKPRAFRFAWDGWSPYLSGFRRTQFENRCCKQCQEYLCTGLLWHDSVHCITHLTWSNGVSRMKLIYWLAILSLHSCERGFILRQPLTGKKYMWNE